MAGTSILGRMRGFAGPLALAGKLTLMTGCAHNAAAVQEVVPERQVGQPELDEINIMAGRIKNPAKADVFKKTALDYVKHGGKPAELEQYIKMFNQEK
jgi:hypothetical protein